MFLPHFLCQKIKIEMFSRGIFENVEDEMEVDKSAGRISDFDLEKFWNFFWNQETYIFKWSDKLFDIPKSCK